LPLGSYGLGTRVVNQDAEAVARGDAFTATADDPSAIYYNPAGLMQLNGFDAEAGAYGIWIDEQYKPLHGEEGAHDSTAHEPLETLPQVFMSYHPKDQAFAIGLGIYSPFGLKIEWPDDASFRQAGLYASLEYIAFNPVLAVQITRSLSMGIGISANYIDAQLREGLSPMPGDSFSFKGDGLSVGGNAGIMWRPTERQSIGLSYHSPVSGDLSGHTQTGLNGTERSEAEAGNAQIAAGRRKLDEGIAYINSLPIPASQKEELIANATAEYEAQLAAAGVPASGLFPTSFPTLAAHGTLKFPQFAVLGYSFRPTPDWNIEADIDWTDWDSLNTVSLHQSNGTTVKIPFNWKHSFLYELGVTRKLPDGFRISAGYIYSENSVPSASYNPAIPDGTLDVFSIGLGRTWDRYSVDIAYQLAYGPTRTIVNDTVADGRYSFLSNAVSVSFGIQF
jgi:long-chain fatty acid transport protein